MGNENNYSHVYCGYKFVVRRKTTIGEDVRRQRELEALEPSVFAQSQHGGQAVQWDGLLGKVFGGEGDLDDL